MDSIRITGGVPLKGSIDISGAKNAALPLMAACLLSGETLTLKNIPHLSDITTMANLLVHHGAELTVASSKPNEGRTLHLNAARIADTTAPYDIVRKMRASVVVLGPLVARFRQARVSLPGGCAIGTRPIDQHLKVLAAMGAEITLQEGYVEAEAKGGLKGADVTFDMVSVGATENALMAATLAKGTTTLRNAAREPEVTDLAECLMKMGADIEGIGTETLIVHGVKSLHAAEHAVMADRIEAGSYAIAAAITGGEILLTGVQANIMEATVAALKDAGVEIDDLRPRLRGRQDFLNEPQANLENPEGVSKASPDGHPPLPPPQAVGEIYGLRVKAPKKILPLNLTTAPYPGFATDMQAQMTALLCLADGTSTVTETIFENRFMHVPELIRMGADIVQRGHTLTLRGIGGFHAAEVMATDLRASLSLVLAALAGHGTTTINRVYHIDRGYERVEEKLAGVGAKIERFKSS